MYTLKIRSDARILLCDPDPDVLERLCDALPGVTGVQTEEQAIDFLMTFEVDLVFLGPELCVVQDGERLPGSGVSVAKFLRDGGNLGQNVILHSPNTTANVEIADILPMARFLPLHSFHVVIDDAQKPITTPARKWALTRDDKKFLKDCGIKW